MVPGLCDRSHVGESRVVAFPHMRTIVVVFALAACGGAAAPVPSAQNPQLPAASEPTATPTPTPSPSPAASSAAPDVPAGADAARDTELATQARAIIEAFANHDAEISPDGKWVAFVSNRDGLNQIYLGEVAHPEAPATRLVSSSERCAAPTFTVDGKAILYVSDRGLDENFSIFRVETSGAHAVTELTPGDKLRHGQPLVPDRAGGPMFFSASRADEREVHVYRAGTDAAGPPTLLYTDPGPGGLVDVSRDGKRALVVRYQSLSDLQLYLVDVSRAGGAAHLLYPAASAHANVFTAAFSADGRRIFVATDEGGESAAVLALDAASGKERGRYVETRPRTSQIAAINVAPTGDRLNILVDAGSHNEVRILDARTLALAGTPELPLGAGGPGRFSHDGKSFTVTWSSPDQPVDVFAIDAARRQVAALRKDARSTLAGLRAIEASVTEVVSFDGTKVPVNLYLPRLPLGAMRKKGPALVIVHGGPAAASEVAWNPWARFWTQQGYAVIEPNVRGSTGFGRAYERADNGKRRLDAVNDMKAVGTWAQSQPWSDGRAVLLGGSYGGYMTLMGLTHQPDLWKAGVDLAGPANLLSFMATTTAEIRAIFIDEFGDPDADRDFLQSISPLEDVAKIAVPLFVYQGANDPRVPEAEAAQIVAALRARKVPVEYMLVANEGHSVEHIENHAMFLGRAARFLEKALATRP